MNSQKNKFFWWMIRKMYFLSFFGFIWIDIFSKSEKKIFFLIDFFFNFMQNEVFFKNIFLKLKIFSLFFAILSQNYLSFFPFCFKTENIFHFSYRFKAKNIYNVFLPVLKPKIFLIFFPLFKSQKYFSFFSFLF